MFNICQVWDAAVTLSEEQGHRTGKDYNNKPLIGLSSQQTYWGLLEIIERLVLFMIKICVILNEGQGQYN